LGRYWCWRKNKINTKGLKESTQQFTWESSTLLSLSIAFKSPLVCDQFLSGCCGDPLGIEALFEPHSWPEVLVILLVTKK